MIIINLLNFVLPGIGFLAWVAVWVALTVLLRWQGFSLFVAVLLGLFSELGFVVFIAEGVYYLTQHKTFFGAARAA